MKGFKFVFLCLCCILFTSCYTTNYYYAVMDSSDPYLEKTGNGKFLVTGDSLNISYFFSGENAPIHVGIKNKSSKTIYADLRDSGVTMDDVFYPYLPPLIINDSLIEEPFFRVRIDKEGIKEIASGDSVHFLLMDLTGLDFENVDKKSYNDTYVQKYSFPDSLYIEQKNELVLKSKNYNELESPVYLDTYMSIYLSYGDFLNMSPLRFRNDFYMSALIEGKTNKPDKLMLDSNKNIFYTTYEKNNPFGTTVSSVLGGALIVLMILTDTHGEVVEY